MAEPRPERVASQLARIQEITHLGIWQWDLSDPAIDWSDELYRIYGLQPRECAITFEKFLEWVHLEDRDRMRSEVNRALDTGRPFAFEHRIVRGDGSVRILESRGEVVRDLEGRALRLVGTSQDLTERRQQEDARREVESHLRQLVESVQAILWRADVAVPKFTFVSREAQALLGYPVERWLQEPAFWIDHVHPDDREWVSSFRARAMRETRDHELEYRMIGAAGDVVWLRDVVRVVTQESGTTEFVGVMIDITESRKASDELRRSREQLQDLSAHIEWVREQERAAISREIHDELGQALTALKMDLGWLGRRLTSDPTPPPRARLLERIATMSQIVDGTIQRVRRISSELRPGLLDDLGLTAAIEWQAREFESRAGVRCEFRSEVSEDWLDRELATAMFRILQETLTNVARHANASRVEVELTQHADRLMLAVRDDGDGIPAEGPGRAHSMGLMGMKERARRLGGLLTVSGRPGRGTEVVVAVPLHPSASGCEAI
ncbi:MAG TPA: PAS domain-containing protein [Vicinamibacteria bacterium]|nr:PAS domain-containing protein [Vicinamibacteria bacterium]